MPILNYTTGIAADASIQEIQKCLAAHGVSAIMAKYDGQGQVEALSFQISMDGRNVGFTLPSDWRPVLKILEQQKKRARGRSRIKDTEDQARRVAWRILKDWVEAQMAVVEMQMVTVDQVFLPYSMMKNGQSLYQHVLSANLLASPAQ